MLLITVASGFESKAKSEINKILSNPDVERLFFKGILVVKNVFDDTNALKLLKETPTKYISRIFPIQKIIKISKDVSSINDIINEVIGLNKISSSDVFRVSCVRRGMHNFSSRDIELALGKKIEETTGAIVNLKDPEKIITIQIFQNECLIGVSEKNDLITKKIIESRKYLKGERPFTRAEFKLVEAIKEFKILIEKESNALDLGAAPGGWTKTLVDYGVNVTAVDPGELHESLSNNPRVKHLKILAKNLPNNIGQFDIITNDMNLNPIESATIMNSVAKYLKKTGIAIMTIKFVSNNRKKHLNDTIEILKENYSNFKHKKLYHNKFETTLFMIKKE
ncbi:hypothetical protein JW865_06695 [Candidatus Bathyarchaeota archaeon]|nr:hypothetical protein [Candidatus Bathyarchaeota archaeon]